MIGDFLSFGLMGMVQFPTSILALAENLVPEIEAEKRPWESLY